MRFGRFVPISTAVSALICAAIPPVVYLVEAPRVPRPRRVPPPRPWRFATKGGIPSVRWGWTEEWSWSDRGIIRTLYRDTRGDRYRPMRRHTGPPRAPDPFADGIPPGPVVARSLVLGRTGVLVALAGGVALATALVIFSGRFVVRRLARGRGGPRSTVSPPG